MEVLVWYGDMYLQFMGIPVTLTTDKQTSQDQEKQEESAGTCPLICDFVCLLTLFNELLSFFIHTIYIQTCGT